MLILEEHNKIFSCHPSMVVTRSASCLLLVGMVEGGGWASSSDMYAALTIARHINHAMHAM